MDIQNHLNRAIGNIYLTSVLQKKILVMAIVEDIPPGLCEAVIVSLKARIGLADLKSFTTFTAEKSEMSANSFISQLEREAEIVGISKS